KERSPRSGKDNVCRCAAHERVVAGAAFDEHGHARVEWTRGIDLVRAVQNRVADVGANELAALPALDDPLIVGGGGVAEVSRIVADKNPLLEIAVRRIPGVDLIGRLDP